MSLKENLGKNIKKYRKLKNITQEKLADIVGIDPKNISRIENGNNYPTSENLSAIAKALDLEVYELYVFSEIDYEAMKRDIIANLDTPKHVIALYKCLKSF